MEAAVAVNRFAAPAGTLMAGRRQSRIGARLRCHGRHRLTRPVFFVLALLTPASLPAQLPSNPLAAVSDRTTAVVEPGLVHTHIAGEATPGRDPWSAHLLAVDLTRYRIDVVLGMDRIVGTETTSALAARKGALASVNGGFFVTSNPAVGDPAGFLVVDGVVVSEPGAGRPALGICDRGSVQELRVVRPTVTIEVTPAPGTGAPPGLNRAREADDLVLYTPVWGDSTRTDPGGVEVVVEGGVVTRLVSAGSAAIPGDGFVLSASGSRVGAVASRYPVGTAVSYSVHTRDPEGRPLEVAGCDFTTAGPVVAAGGAVREDYGGEAYREGFVLGRHPRTAVGVSADGATLYLFAIDGRQAGYSAGATLAELAGLLVAEGASTVYNLDGGGSTTLVLLDRVLNRPSDGAERRPSDVLLVTRR